MNVKLGVKGHKSTMARFNKARNSTIDELVRQLDAEAEKVMQEAQVEVPKDTGALHDTIRRDRTLITKSRGIEVVIKAGGARAPYALYVHEDLNAYHAPPTKAKFLEDPFRRSVSGISGRLVVKINAALKKAGF